MNFKILINKALLVAGVLSFVMPAAAEMSVEDRVEELEVNQSLNIFKFSGSTVLSYDGYEDDTSGTKTTAGFHRMRVGLDFSAKPFDNVTFFGRLTGSKFLNTVGDLKKPQSGLDVTRAENGESAYIEKAYFDYAANDYLVFSGGRFPTLDGVPTNYQYGKAKMGTYPMLAYNTTLEGYALTYKLGKHFNENLSIRALYHPFSSPKLAQAENQTLYNINRDSAPTSNMGTLMLDYSSGQLSWADNFNFIAQMVKLNTLKLGDVVFYHAQAGQQTLASTLQFRLDLQVIHFDIEDLLDSGVNLSVTNYTSKVENEGSINAAGLGMGQLGFGGAGDSTSTGSGTLVAFNYRTPWKLIVGGDYLTSDKNFLFFNGAAEDLTGYYSTRGTASQVYVAYPLENTLVLTVGMRNQDHEYTLPLSLFGAPTKADKKVSTGYASMRLDF